MQKNDQGLPTYAMTIIKSNNISAVENFAIEQVFNNLNKKNLIINDKQEGLSIDSNYIYNYFTKSPQKLIVDPSNLNQYDKVFCIIDPRTYDNSSEMIIKFLANRNVKTHYFILKQSIHLGILERIDCIYLQADAQKYIQLQKLNKQNTLKNHLKQKLFVLKNHLFSFKAMLCNMITNTYFLCFIIKITDTPKFPWPDWQSLILDSAYLTIMLKWLLE